MDASAARRLSKPASVILAATVAVAVWFIWTAVAQHQQFQTHGHDLGIFDQAIWHLSRFETPSTTVRKIMVPNIFGDHFHPILLAVVPFYWLFSSPYVLLVGQALLLAAVLPLIYFLARRLDIGPWPAAALAVAGGINPGLLSAIRFDFHEVAFAPALFLAVALTAAMKRWRWYWPLLAAFILTKESMALYATLFGLTMILRRQYRPGLLTCGLGLTAFFLIIRLAIPAFSPGLGYAYWDQYRHLAPRVSGLPAAFITHPGQFIQAVVDDPAKRQTIGLMFGSFAFLPILSWTTWPLTLATLAERFWSNASGLWLFQFHYQLLMVAIFAVGTLYVLHDAQRRWPRRRIIAPLIGVAVLVGTLVVYRALPSTTEATAWPTSLQRASWRFALSVIPPTVPVSAQDAFVPHLAHRDRIYQFPRVRDAAWIILDPAAPSWPLTPGQVRQWQTWLRSAGWRAVYENGSLTVFARQTDSQALSTVNGWE